MARVLAIGDTHEPVTHPGYLAFCQDIAEAWDIDTVVHIGDVVDWHAVSFHARHPEAPGPMDEFELALAGVQRWYTAFPNVVVTVGNHDARLTRLAESVNIPARFLRNYGEIWETPGWTWVWETEIDGVYYFHGTGNGGVHPAFNVMRKQLMSTVMGHTHTAGGVKWSVGPTARLFGMDTGCGVDDQAAAMAYGRHLKQKSVLGCGVVIDGMPYHEVMPMARGERYHRSRFEGRGRGRPRSLNRNVPSGRGSSGPGGGSGGPCPG